MDTRFLESLLAVVETGSIAAAARYQGLTAAAVSQRIRVLEAELGCRLLVRSAQSAKPTSECLRMLGAARDLVRDADRLAVHVTLDGLRGPYRLGTISTAMLDCVPKVVRQFRLKAPDVQLAVRPGSSQSLFEEFKAGIVDAVIVVAPPFTPPKEVKQALIAEEPFCLIRPAHAGAVSDEENLPWIVYDRSTWGGRQIAKYFDKDRGDVPTLCELDSLETIAAMVEEGLGQAIVPIWGRLEDLHPTIKIIPLGASSAELRSVVLLQNGSSAVRAIDRLLLNTLSVI